MKHFPNEPFIKTPADFLNILAIGGSTSDSIDDEVVIFDAHLHLPCFDECVSLEDKKNRLLHDLKKANAIGGIVISDSELTSKIGTAEECINLLYDCPNIYVVGGISPLIDYKSRLEALDQLLSEGKLIGLKLYPGHEHFFMNDERLSNIYKICIKHDVPLLVHTGWDNPDYNHPKYFARIAEKYPNLRIVICHLWWPNVDLCYDVTAPYPNIYYDISSLAYDERYIDKTTTSLRRITMAHSDRIILGSDYGMCSIKAHIELARSLGLTQKEEQMILADNALRLYNLPLS
jgi:predicted TIM-barrel fold metal-dependent hydrolase